MIDWDRGLWRKTISDGDPPDQRIIIAGDWAPIRRYRDTMVSDPEAVYGDLLVPLRQADLRIVNVETSLSVHGAPIVKDGPNLQGPPEAVLALACVPFDVGCLANNHMMDYGPEALADTRARLTGYGILPVGAGLSREEALTPLVVTIGETRVGIINFCEGEDNTSAVDGPGVFGWEIATVIDRVRRLRPYVDLLLVIAHAGREYTPAPPPYIQRAYRAIAEAGAEVIVGHHPHVPQGVEIFGGVPIAYSLGNFIFDQETAVAFRRRGYLVELCLNRRELSGLDLLPYALGADGVSRLIGDVKRRFLEHLRVASEALTTPGGTAALWHAYIDSQGERFWREARGGLTHFISQTGDDPHVAAKLRNRFITPAHRHFLADGLTRLIDGTLGTAPGWATDLVALWAGEGT
ncbi:MAG: CapA family protein [Anaerolineae bacterium]|nr:CapA family protein [Anaerolineae bacterium]